MVEQSGEVVLLAKKVDMLREAVAAARSGNKGAARHLLQKACAQDPNNEQAWLWRASLAETPDEARGYLEKVLQLDPNHKTALSWLARLRNEPQRSTPVGSGLRSGSPAATPAPAQRPPAPPAAVTAPVHTDVAPPPTEKPKAAPAWPVPARHPSQTVGNPVVPAAVTPAVAAASAVPHGPILVPPRTAAPPAPTLSPSHGQATRVRPVPADDDEVEAHGASATDCPMCGFANGALNAKCTNCKAILSLADVDAITKSRDANEDLVKQAVERYQRMIPNGGAQAHINLAVAYLNLHSASEALRHLKAAAKLAPHEPHLEQALKTVQKRALILIVDDSATVRKLVTSTLERNNYRTIVAADGMEALAKLNEDIPDLVLLDITMPRMGGYQVCKIIKDNATTKKVPVVMLSGNDGFFDKVKGRLAGATDYLTKPFEPSLLVKSLEKYLKA